MVLAHASGYPKHLENNPNRNGFAQRGGPSLCMAGSHLNEGKEYIAM